MKQCPKCLKTYDDETTFCLDDGTRLDANVASNQPESGANQTMPTMLSNSPLAPLQNYQPPQIPAFTPNANQSRTFFTPLRVILGLLVLAIGVGGIIAAIAVIGLLAARNSSPDYAASTNYNYNSLANSGNRSPFNGGNMSGGNMRTNLNSSGNLLGGNLSNSVSSSEPSLFPSRNGFVRADYTEDVSDAFPSSIKSTFHCYDRASPKAFVCGQAAIYSSTAAANVGYDEHLRLMTGTKGSILEKGNADNNPYVYYKDEYKKDNYHFCVLIGTQVTDYNAASISLLQEFLK